jgi:hypothetical protein
MNTKKEYLKILEEYIAEQIFITDNSNDIDKEIDKNYWLITGTNEQISSLTSTEWLDYFNRLIVNRQCQLNNSKVKTDLVFYCYHDELAGQLRFNIISATHTKLPFGCKYIEDTLENVLNAFINDKYNGSIPWGELKPISKDETEMLEKEKNEYILKVYIKRLIKEN